MSHPPIPATSRLVAPLALAVLAAGAPQAAQAGDRASDRAVARLVAFSGACSKCELSGRRLAGVRFIGADFREAALVGTDLRQAQFLGSSFRDANLSRADLRAAEMLGADFTAADLSHSNLVGALISGTRFVKASLRDADLSRAILTGNAFADADFRGASLRGTIIAGADLSRAGGLSQTQVDQACGDAGTRLPPRLSVNVCVGVKVFVRPGPRHLVWPDRASPRP